MVRPSRHYHTGWWARGKWAPHKYTNPSSREFLGLILTCGTHTPTIIPLVYLFISPIWKLDLSCFSSVTCVDSTPTFLACYYSSSKPACTHTSSLCVTRVNHDLLLRQRRFLKLFPTNKILTRVRLSFTIQLCVSVVINNFMNRPIYFLIN